MNDPFRNKLKRAKKAKMKIIFKIMRKILWLSKVIYNNSFESTKNLNFIISDHFIEQKKSSKDENDLIDSPDQEV